MNTPDNITRRIFLNTSGKVTLASCSACLLASQDSAHALTIKTEYVAACGIYCGSCEALIASEKATKSSEFKCLGCMSSKKKRCEVGQCAKGKRLASCGLCKELDTCQKLKDWLAANNKPYRVVALNSLQTIKKNGLKAWEKEQAERWKCKKCGTKASWNKTEKCEKCGTDLYSIQEEFDDLKK